MDKLIAVWSFLFKTKTGKATGGLGLSGGILFLMMNYVDGQISHAKENLNLKYDGLKNEVVIRDDQVNKDIGEIKGAIKTINANIIKILSNKK